VTALSRLALLAGLSCAAAASAQDFARSGPYATGQLALSIPLSDLSRLDTGVGGAGRFGWRLTERVAVEAQVEYSGSWGSGALHQTVATANAKLYFAEKRVQPYALLGLGGAFASSRITRDDGSFAVRAGAGVDLYLEERVGVLVEAAFVAPTGSRSDVESVSVGLGVFYRW
jgi:hypothetical protein